MMITKDHKILVRYFIVALLMAFTFYITGQAYGLEVTGNLTMQFAGIVASAYGVLTLAMKFIFQSKVEE